MNQHAKTGKRYALLTTGVAFCLLTPVFFAYANNFIPLSPSLPILGRNWAQGMSNFLNVMLTISIALAAILAVMMVAIGGFQYMTTDSAFQISGAKERIANAIIGLLIVLVAILLLRTINPCIVSLSLFSATGTTCTQN